MNTKKGGLNILYSLIAFIGGIIRSLLPNPFENLPNGDFLNFVASFILWAVSYIIVGTINSDGEPWLGSFLYTAVYSGLTCLLHVWGQHDFSLLFAFKWVVIICIVSRFLSLFEPSHEEKYWGKKPVK